MPKRSKLEKIVSNKREVKPRVVQLGAGIPSLRTDVDYTWAYPIDVTAGNLRSTSVTPGGGGATAERNHRSKNLFEFNKRHTNTFNFKTNSWKIPSIGNNFLPFKGKGLHVNQSSEEVVGLYRPKFQRWYSRLVHENTVVLPPIETSQRVKENTYEASNYNEKKYIDKERRTTGPRERFARDELYLPNVYSQCFSCRECRKQYANEVYNQTWTFRNSPSPFHAGKHVSPRATDQTQHCDVLGERYCKDCIENRNKRISLMIEDQLLNNNNLAKVHYESEVY